MFQRQRSGSVLCPSCGSLVGVNDAACLICGRRRPGLFGFAAALKQTGDDMGFLALVVATCGALFIASVFASEDQLGGGGLFNALAPHSLVLLRFGATGSIPVFEFDRFWTVLAAPWLHGNLLHIVMNMLGARTLIPIVAHLYGPARTILLYVAAGSSGALLTSVVAEFLPGLPGRLGGSPLSIGASGAIFGLIGALLYYGRRSGSRMITEQARQWAIGGLVYGFMLPRVDNWGHLGGLAAGYLVGRWLDPLLPERGDHVLAAVAALLLSAAAVVASLLVPLP